MLAIRYEEGRGELTSYSHCIVETISESRGERKQKGETDRLSIDAIENGSAAIYGENGIGPGTNSLAVVSSHSLAASGNYEIGESRSGSSLPTVEPKYEHSLAASKRFQGG